MAGPVVYVASPLGQRTAGPEALTQLVDAVRRRGIDARLIAMRGYRGRSNDPEYARYDAPIADRIADPGAASLVIPEISPIESARELRAVPRERTWMGWFSVSNSPDPRARYFRPGPACCSAEPLADGLPAVPADYRLGTGAGPGPFRTVREAIARQGGLGPGSLRGIAVDTVSIRFARSVIDSEGIRFFAQSAFARGFVREVLGRSAPIITDPLRLAPYERRPLRPATVAYNATKSWSLIDEVARLLPEVEFMPIGGVPYEEGLAQLASSAAYLELGHLPGRDRMPREAAHVGTPVVLLARGSGFCVEDAPLPGWARIPYREGWPALAAAAVARVMGDRARAIDDQRKYAEWVAGEHDRYERAIDDWLRAVLA